MDVTESLFRKCWILNFRFPRNEALYFSNDFSRLTNNVFEKEERGLLEIKIDSKKTNIQFFRLIVRGPEKNYILKISESIIFWIG